MGEVIFEQQNSGKRLVLSAMCFVPALSIIAVLACGAVATPLGIMLSLAVAAAFGFLLNEVKSLFSFAPLGLFLVSLFPAYATLSVLSRFAL